MELKHIIIRLNFLDCNKNVARTGCKNNDVFKETLEGFVKEDSPLQES